MKRGEKIGTRTCTIHREKVASNIENYKNVFSWYVAYYILVMRINYITSSFIIWWNLDLGVLKIFNFAKFGSKIEKGFRGKNSLWYSYTNVGNSERAKNRNRDPITYCKLILIPLTHWLQNWACVPSSIWSTRTKAKL